MANIAPRRVLIVDDEERVLLVFEGALLALGPHYEISTASSGTEALQKLQEEPFDLVITDVRMPRLGGIELTERIRATENREDTKVIWITAYGGEETQREADRLNVLRCLAKPVEIQELRRAVRTALNNNNASASSYPGIHSTP